MKLLVLSHLRWNFVTQRPQHLMSRLAKNRHVLFFEEPVVDDKAFIATSQPQANVLVCTPHTPSTMPGFHDQQLPLLKTLLEELLAGENAIDVWFYTPMALPLIQNLKPRTIVYDCMDELSAFLNAPRQLLQRETALLKAADLVFTGGASLYQVKKDRHPRVYCFPSSVDAAHFAQALAAENEAPAQANLPRPRLGFFGVIDERIDVSLLSAIASAHPEWQIVMVGPIVKIDASTLPRAPNIHYFGQQRYEELPGFLSGWDVCLLPFAQNAATRYISPTKTLEYMAAERPIVSTPITDVAQPYGDMVYLGGTQASFIAACEQALGSTLEERARRVAKMRAVLARTSWDATAREMEQLIDSLPARGGQAAKPPFISSDKRDTDRTLPVVRAPVVKFSADHPDIVIGAGPTGLSAAYHLGERSLLIEQNSTVGGWCRSIYDRGFTFDYAGHIMFSHDPYVHRMYKLLLGDNVHWQDREAWVYSKNVYTRYPFQGALYGLPPEVIEECIIGAIEARFGSIAPPDDCKAEPVSDCCGDGILEASAKLAKYRLASADRRAKPRNFEDFIYRVWGAGIAKHFAIPYNRKLWAVPLNEMETSWLGGRVPLPDLSEMIAGALAPLPKPMGPNARFGYPLRGGFQAMMNGFLPHLKGEIRLKTRVAKVTPSKRTVTLDDGSERSYRTLISTMPLPRLVQAIGDEAPSEIVQAANALRHVSVRCVNLGIARENVTDKHWIYYPEDTVFHRIFVQGNASPYCNPPGGFGITCEITYSPYKPLPCDGDDLVSLCFKDCVRAGMLREDDRLLVANQLDLPYAYVVYDHARAANVKIVREWLVEKGIVLAGRYSEWEYYNSDHAFIAGKRAAAEVRQDETTAKLSA
jgi:protoporphyrinogen oxidase/glycosyltransferase involved in cell wall biosynthesis